FFVTPDSTSRNLESPPVRPPGSTTSQSSFSQRQGRRSGRACTHPARGWPPSCSTGSNGSTCCSCDLLKPHASPADTTSSRRNPPLPPRLNSGQFRTTAEDPLRPHRRGHKKSNCKTSHISLGWGRQKTEG